MKEAGKLARLSVQEQAPRQKTGSVAEFQPVALQHAPHPNRGAGSLRKRRSSRCPLRSPPLAFELPRTACPNPLVH